jgi:hypothetical protein
MLTTNDVYRKIKELSTLNLHPRPPIMLGTLAGELLTFKENIRPALDELKDLRLIQFDETSSLYVKLTLLGFSVTRSKP